MNRTRQVFILVFAAFAVGALAPVAASAAISFAPQLNFDTSSAPDDVAVGQFNGGTDPDLAVTNGNSVSIFLGSTGGTFLPETVFPAGSSSTATGIGDFNRDGDPDLAVANALSNNVSILIGGSGGSFITGPTIATGGEPDGIAVADFNADDDLDLVTSNQDTGDATVLLGSFGASFGAATSFGAASGAPESVAVGDFNNDADPDLAVGRGTFGNNISILLGGAGGSFAVGTSVAAGATNVRDVAVGDFNGDLEDDLATATDSGARVLLGNGDTTFGAPISPTGVASPESVTVADLNADNDPDLAFASDTTDRVAVLAGAAGGTFTAATTYLVTDRPFGVASGDFDLDAKPDLVAANLDGFNISVLLNTSRAGIALSPAGLAFGSQLIDTTSRQKTIAVTNNGDATLSVADVRVVGAHFADFEVERETCMGDSLPRGASCGVAVVFTPTDSASRTATLRITSNALGSPHNVPLTGTGAVPTCAGLDATIVGTTGADVLFGTPGNDVVALLAGDDSFRGDAGNDTVCGASGDDELNGQAGLDTIRGASGDDELRGEQSNDTLYGQSGDDDLYGGTGAADTCHGGSDADTADAFCETVTGIP